VYFDSTFCDLAIKVLAMNAPFDPALWAQDANPQETAEWRDALLSLLANEGPDRVNQILNSLSAVARQHRTGWQPDLNTPYANTISVDDQPEWRGNTELVGNPISTRPMPTPFL